MNRQLFWKGFNSLYLMLFITTSIGLMGCSTINAPEQPKVCIDKDFEISYQGKGSAMGMMMTSSMGPMGIAIGVAIDEGRKKEIEESLLVDELTLVDSIVLRLRKNSGTQFHFDSAYRYQCDLTISALNIVERSEVTLNLTTSPSSGMINDSLDSEAFDALLDSNESLSSSIINLIKRYFAGDS